MTYRRWITAKSLENWLPSRALSFNSLGSFILKWTQLGTPKYISIYLEDQHGEGKPTWDTVPKSCLIPSLIPAAWGGFPNTSCWHQRIRIFFLGSICHKISQMFYIALIWVKQTHKLLHSTFMCSYFFSWHSFVWQHKQNLCDSPTL